MDIEINCVFMTAYQEKEGPYPPPPPVQQQIQQSSAPGSLMPSAPPSV